MEGARTILRFLGQDFETETGAKVTAFLEINRNDRFVPHPDQWQFLSEHPDLWGRKKTLLLGTTLKAVSFSLLPFWSSYEGFLFYHLTMGIALSMISGGDVALIWDSYLADGGEKSRGAAGLGHAMFASPMGATTDGRLRGRGVVS